MKKELVFMLIPSMGDRPLTTSQNIAESAGVQHRTIARTIRKYWEAFEDFGKVHVVTQRPPDKKSGRGVKTYLLNEPQVSLLVMYLPNTPATMDFKVWFIEEMDRMRRELIESLLEDEDD